MKKFKLAFFVLALFSTAAHSQSADTFEQQIKALSEEEKTELVMGSGDPVELYNFVKGEKEIIYRIDKLSADKFEEYLPPLDEVKAMFQLYVSHGLTPYEAYAQSMAQLMNLLLSE